MSQVSIPKKAELTRLESTWKDIQTLKDSDKDGYVSRGFCLALPTETVKSYLFRKAMFAVGFRNPTIELLTAPGSLIYSNNIKETINTAVPRLLMFSKDVDRGNDTAVPLRSFLENEVCPSLRGYGTVFVLLDMPDIGENVSEAQQRDNQIYPYATLLDPLSVVNYEMDDNGFVWFAYKVQTRELWTDPLEKEPTTYNQVRVWTRDKYFKIIFGKKQTIEEFPNRFGFVPVVVQALYKGVSGSVLGIAPFFNSQSSIISANNHLNVVNMEIWKHASALLLFPRSSLNDANSSVDHSGVFHIKTLADDGALVYEGDKAPDFLTRDLNVIKYAKEQFMEYMQDAFDNEKNAKRMGNTGYGGADAASSSGFAKLISREPLVANVVSTAMTMQRVHRNIMGMAATMILGAKPAEMPFVVEYDMEYNIEPLVTLLDNAKKLFTDIDTPSETLRRELHKKIAANLVTDMTTLSTINDEIDAADVMKTLATDNVLLKALNGSGQKILPPAMSGAPKETGKGMGVQG